MKMTHKLCYALWMGWLTLAAPAQAQTLEDSYDHWRVFTVNQGGNKLCYLASLPTKKQGNYSKRSDPYLLVTHKTATHDEISVSSGYRFRDNQDVIASFGQKQHKMFTKGELAWAYDVASDKAMVKDMMRGSDLVIKGTSWKGTTSQDTYSLKGFTAAHQRMKQLCN